MKLEHSITISMASTVFQMFHLFQIQGGIGNE